MRKYLTYLHRNLLSKHLHGSVKKIMVTGLFSVLLDDQDRKERSRPKPEVKNKLTRKWYQQFIVARDTKFPFHLWSSLQFIYDVTTRYFIRSLPESRHVWHHNMVILQPCIHVSNYIYLKKKIITEIQFNDSYHRFV